MDDRSGGDADDGPVAVDSTEESGSAEESGSVEEVGSAEESEAVDDDGPPPDGLVTVRGAAFGVGLLWLAAISAFGALQATIYGVRVAPPYLLVAIVAAALSVAAGYGSMRAFGLK